MTYVTREGARQADRLLKGLPELRRQHRISRREYKRRVRAYEKIEERYLDTFIPREQRDYA